MGMTLESRRSFGFKLAAVGAIGISSLASAGEFRRERFKNVNCFRQLVGKRFTVTSEQKSLVVQLREVRDLKKLNDTARPLTLPRRQALSLIFSPVDRNEKLDQVYQLDHRDFGGSTISLMPVGLANELEAVLN